MTQQQTMNLIPCAILPFIGLFFSSHVFRSIWRRALIITLTLLSAISGLTSLTIDNQTWAYHIGFILPWIVIRTFTMYWIYEPWKNCIVARIVPTKDQDAFRVVWEGYPATVSLKRLRWVFDLLLDFRAVEWCYSASDGKPCNFHQNSKSLASFRRQAESLTPELEIRRVLFRLLASLAWIESCTVFVFPKLRAMLLQQEIGEVGPTSSIPPGSALFVTLEIAVSLSSTLAFVDLIHTAFRLLYLLLGQLGFNSFLLSAMAPSPWGGINDICDKGISGMQPVKLQEDPCPLLTFLGFWGGFWHNYFRLGFRLIARYFSPPVKTSPRIRSFLQLCIIFFISGIMHMCGSLMYREHNKPVTGQLFFFCLQPFGLLLERITTAVLMVKMERHVRRVVNLIIFLVWMYWTFPFFVEDQIRGGYWERSLLQIL